MGMMPVSEIKIEKTYKDDLGFSIIIQAGEHGWTILFSDGSSIYDDIDNKMVYIVTENTISKLDITTGKVLWSNKLGVKLYSGIGHGNKLYFMGAYDDTMYILDINKGSLIDSIKVNEGEYTYEFITGMADILIFGYFDGTVNYIEFDTITNTIINE